MISFKWLAAAALGAAIVPTYAAASQYCVSHFVSDDARYCAEHHIAPSEYQFVHSLRPQISPRTPGLLLITDAEYAHLKRIVRGDTDLRQAAFGAIVLHGKGSPARNTDALAFARGFLKNEADDDVRKWGAAFLLIRWETPDAYSECLRLEKLDKNRYPLSTEFAALCAARLSKIQSHSEKRK